MKPRAQFSIVVLVVAALLGLYLNLTATGNAPVCIWHVGVEENTEAFTQVRPGTPLSLHVDLPFAAHVYVASHNPADGTIALFPSPWLRTEANNPLSAGSHQLPGTIDGRELRWPAPLESGPTSYMVVLSVEPIGELDELFEKIRQIGNMAFTDGSFNVSAPKEGGMAVVPPHNPIPGPILQAAADSLTSLEQNGPMVPWLGDPQLGEDPRIYLSTFRIAVVE